MDDLIPQEANYPLFAVLTALSAGYSIWGAFNVMEGMSNNDPSVREQGERQLKAGRTLAILASYVQEGIMQESDIMKYLATQ